MVAIMLEWDDTQQVRVKIIISHSVVPSFGVVVVSPLYYNHKFTTTCYYIITLLIIEDSAFSPHCK